MDLVTGGTGLVGSHLLMELARAGRPVRAIHRAGSDLQRVRRLFAWYGPELAMAWDAIQWVEAELSDLPALEAALAGASRVYHCAGLISFDPSDRNHLLKTNFEGTRNVVNCCLGLGIKQLCHVSSIATIGSKLGSGKEEDPWDPQRTNVYATSKYLAEMEAWRGGQEGLEVAIVNPGVVLGPGSYDSGSGRLIAAAGNGLRYYPPGGTGFVGVGDVVRAMILLMDGGHFNNRYLLVGNNLSYREILGQIAGVLEVRAPEKPLKYWQMNFLRPLDWLASHIFGRKRRLTGAQIRSFRNPKQFDNGKILKTLGDFQFTDIRDILEICGRHYRETANS
ncbi:MULTISPECIES: NAD-dependent epimerase/dehydratase family protein [unclassified Robiginitalea]|uniref:NAD-dependent epimerase/dehydratase family protein n=1 Tax=Robiginitalea TaxID=252306 RepID=UPI00234A4F34|nr:MULTISPECIES: NAD-dependent epimerase/dehydratase family protein [unclassified Robiginitalea]MDC6352892.1 NAD-dependent epimerase/dehydratase family protein [Robiginitalea sp. PM2]MDC6373941.1 NAD-dependent epimerase/dehydratase family protein [Robiginitalea sp. SP8]